MGAGPPSLTVSWSLETTLLLAVVAAILVCAGVWLLIPVLRRRQILDRPNARSSHVAPTPRGGGVAVVLILLPFLAAWFVWRSEMSLYTAIPILGGATLLAVTSWIDDLRGLGPLPRLGAQFVATGAVILPAAMQVLSVQPAVALILLAVLVVWVWFINLFNFMDGIDGITAIETVVCAGGMAVVALTYTPAGVLFGPAVLMVAAALGFIVWNWHPARVFLGDVGSIPLGFLLGWMLLILAINGAWAAALILPSYYLTDATLTLLRRILRGEKFWRAHKEHFYQRAVQAGRSHSQVSLAVGLAGVPLIALAWWSTQGHEWQALGAAAIVVILLMAWMSPRRIEPAETGT